jgi:hypothetical protein
MSAADLRAWAETPGGRLRAALGIPSGADPAVNARIVARGEEIIEAAKADHRARWEGDPPEWRREAGEAAAAAEGQQMSFVSSYGVAEAWNSRDPLNRMGIQAEEGSRGFAMAVHTSAGTTYQGDPGAVAQLQASLADAQRRQAAAMANEAGVLGPLYRTVA